MFVGTSETLALAGEAINGTSTKVVNKKEEKVIEKASK
jgi:hypothetical protein